MRLPYRRDLLIACVSSMLTAVVIIPIAWWKVNSALTQANRAEFRAAEAQQELFEMREQLSLMRTPAVDD